MKLQKRNFSKYQGALNDFVFFFEEAPQNNMNLQALVVNACERNRGIGADGAVFLSKDAAGTFHWRFFNRDGSETDVCGNAARCTAAALFSQLPPETLSATWEGSLGHFEAQKIGPHSFEVNWPIDQSAVSPASDPLLEELSALNDFGLAGAYLVQAGVPHLVLLNHECWSVEHRLSNSPQLRHHESLGRAGANVTWVSLKNFQTVTFERGVEGETYACGSGALASFLAVEQWRKENSKTVLTKDEFHFPGGTLTVRRDQKETSKLWLGGEARLVFSGTWEF